MRDSPTPPPTTWLEAVQQWSDSWWAVWRAAWPQMPWPPAGTLMPPPSATEVDPAPIDKPRPLRQRPPVAPLHVRSGKRGR